jgi:hypothetical protein
MTVYGRRSTVDKERAMGNGNGVLLLLLLLLLLHHPVWIRPTWFSHFLSSESLSENKRVLFDTVLIGRRERLHENLTDINARGKGIAGMGLTVLFDTVL